jgi:hypothetical protein
VQGSTTFLAALALAVAFLATAMPAVAHADETIADDARAAYDRGTAAHARGDYRAAASELAEADALAPNTIALKAALDEALLADDAELGMRLVERARRRAPGDATLAPSVRDAVTRFAARTGQVRVDCGSRRCSATIDARPMDPSLPAIVLAGSHHVTIEKDGVVTTKDVVVPGSHEVDVVLPPPAPPPPSPPRPLHSEGTSGLPKGWFVAAAGATLVMGGLALGSGLDTANQHSTFATQGCGAAGAPSDCTALASNGANAQTRTNVLAAIAGSAGVTAVTLAFFTRWRSPALRSASLVVGDRTASLLVRF